MKNTHAIGDIGLMKVAAIATSRGYGVCLPISSHLRYDLILERNNKLERVQVKTTNSNGEFIIVRTKSIGKKNGKLIQKKYSQEEIDCIIVYDITSDMCYYLSSELLGNGKNLLILRLSPTKNNNAKKIRWAKDYVEW